MAKTSLPIGLIHGLAGSGAAVVLATAQATSQGAALIFLVVFVLGSTLSMTAAAGFLSVPLGRPALRELVGLSGHPGFVSPPEPETLESTRVFQQGTMRRSLREMLSRTAISSGEPQTTKKPSRCPTLEP